MPEVVDLRQARRYATRMADVINLRIARKARDRVVRDSDAAANRAAFGQTKAEKRIAHDAKARINALLDGARRDDQ